MDQIYLAMLISMVVLATVNLIVGVSNDAVNFLNSALGSKAVPYKTILTVASLGILVGALSSSGMMEIAREGIFNPAEFNFNDLIIIFTSVMITDIIILDILNSSGLPTSTTVSVIFELLGASVCVALNKLYHSEEDLTLIFEFINTVKLKKIIYSIFISIVFAFIIGAVIQFFSRLVFSFEYKNKLKYFGAIFGSVATTAILFFIFIKGLKNVSFIDNDFHNFYATNQTTILITILIMLLIVFQSLILFFKVNILKIVVVIGTFALALAFSGNDLVNFIGVPIAAFNALEISRLPGFNGDMSALGDQNIIANPLFLGISGLIMVITLWTSKKARSVTDTEINLGRQNSGQETFKPNFLARFSVNVGFKFIKFVNSFLPKKILNKIDEQFKNQENSENKIDKNPAFDLIRASVNLMVASILISIGTSSTLPLSTTYVTFMVAMGTSFADRAWDRESAVYRVAGVINVIGSWFITAISAFVAAFAIAYLLIVGQLFAFILLLIVVAILLFNNYRRHKIKTEQKNELEKFKQEDIITINEIIVESAIPISKVVETTNQLFTMVIQNLGLQDLNKLKENKKELKKLEKEVDELKGNVYYFIKNLDETSVEASKFYVMILGYLQDMVQSLSFVTQNSLNHISNNHKQLKFNQIRDLKNIDIQLTSFFKELEIAFTTNNFSKIDTALSKKEDLMNFISELIQKQIARIRTTETSPKNSKLYFGLLLETNDLVKSTMGLLELFQEFDVHVKAKKNLK